MRPKEEICINLLYGSAQLAVKTIAGELSLICIFLKRQMDLVMGSDATLDWKARMWRRGYHMTFLIILLREHFRFVG